MTSTAADTVNDSYRAKSWDNKGLARICRLCNIEQKSQARICHHLAFFDRTQFSVVRFMGCQTETPAEDV